MEVFRTLRRIFRHFRMRQLADRIGKQGRAAIVAIFTDKTFRVALDLRHAGGVQVLDDFIDGRLCLSSAAMPTWIRPSIGVPSSSSWPYKGQTMP